MSQVAYQFLQSTKIFPLSASLSPDSGADAGSLPNKPILKSDILSCSNSFGRKSKLASGDETPYCYCTGGISPFTLILVRTAGREMAFRFKVDSRGAWVEPDQDQLTVASLNEANINLQIRALKDELDHVAERMKRALKEVSKRPTAGGGQQGE